MKKMRIIGPSVQGIACLRSELIGPNYVDRLDIYHANSSLVAISLISGKQTVVLTRISNNKCNNSNVKSLKTENCAVGCSYPHVAQMWHKAEWNLGIQSGQISTLRRKYSRRTCLLTITIRRNTCSCPDMSATTNFQSVLTSEKSRYLRDKFAVHFPMVN